MARRVVRDRGAVLKLFDEIAPRYLARRGGYTRIVKLGQRPGDAAPMSLLELIPEDAPASTKAPEDKGGKGKGAPAKTPEKTGEAGRPARKAEAKSESKSEPKAGAKPTKGAAKPKKTDK
jgi:large subunit ribosomal protein L17